MSEELITLDPDEQSEMARDLRLDRDGRIAKLKAQLHAAILQYRIHLAAGSPIGPAIQAYLKPNLHKAACQANAVARQLHELDPTMPDWDDLPMGHKVVIHYPYKETKS